MAATKRLFFFVFILISGLLSINAQNSEIKEGPSFVSEKGRAGYFIGQDETGFYVARATVKAFSSGLCIQKIEFKTLFPIYDILLDDFESNVEIIGNKILVFTNKYEKKEKTLYVSLQEFDAKTGKEIEPRKQLVKTPVEPKDREINFFTLKLSQDKSKMAIIHQYKNENAMPEIDVTIYSTERYQKLAEKKLNCSYNNRSVSCTHFILDNSGDFYYLFNYSLNNEPQISEIAVGLLKLSDSSPIITPLPLQNNIGIMNGTFEMFNNDLVFAGAFKNRVGPAERKEGKRPEVGIYSFFVDKKTGQVKTKGFDYFSAEAAQKLTYKARQVKKYPAEKHYSIKTSIISDSAMYLLESHSYLLTYNNAYISYERELIVSKLNTKGKIEWMKVVPKFTGDELSDFNYLVKNNKLYLFYGEHPKNLENGTVNNYDPKECHPAKDYNGPFCVCTSIDAKGILERKVLFRNIEWCYSPLAGNILSNSDNAIFLRLVNHLLERYDRVTIDN